MKLLVVFLFVAAAAALKVDEGFLPRHGLPPAEAPRSISRTPTWGTIYQKLDNFDPNNNNLWSMRYIGNDQFFKSGGPIFILLGAEWTIDEGWLRSSQMFDMAQIHSAQMYYTEHRYYGQSYPTRDLTTASLKYLSVDQALADVAHFIETIKNNNPNFANSKVVVFGGSYGGTMATWMRQKYPNLVHAAVASSAPLWAKVDYFEYHEVVRRALGPSCSSILSNAAQEIRRLISTGYSSTVQRDYKVCYPFKSDYDVQTLFTYIANSFAGKIQNAQPNTANEVCTKLSNPNLPSDYMRLAGYINDQYCKGDYDFTTNYYKNTSLNNGDGRQWFYQTCSDFGFFQTAWASNSLYNYGISPEYYLKQCQDVFGAEFSPEHIYGQVDKTNNNHGALQPNVDRVISVHGSVDPWSSIGLKADSNPRAPVYVVTGTSHCADMYSLGSWGNNNEMYYAKQAIVNYIASWLNEP